MEERSTEAPALSRPSRAAGLAVRSWLSAVVVVPVLLGAAVAAQGGVNAFALLLSVAAVVVCQAAASTAEGRKRAPGLVGHATAVLLYGPILAAAGYAAQARMLDVVPVLYGLPVGCLAAAVLYLRTAHARGSAGGAKRVVIVCVAAAYLLVTLGALAGSFVRGAGLVALCAPLACAVCRRAGGAGGLDLLVLEGDVARVHLVFGLLLVVGVLLPIS